MPTTPRRLLMLAHEFPPSAGGGVSRLSKFAAHLRDDGWDVTVLSGVPAPGRPYDESLLATVEGIEVVRIPARDISHTFARLLAPLKGLRRRPSPAPPEPAVAASASAAPRAPLSSRMARWVAVPDNAGAWGRAAERTAARLHRERPFDVVFASGPPFTALVAATRFGAAASVPVVADMRDAWRDNISLVWPTDSHRRRSEALEREVMAAAVAVTCVSADIAAEASEMGAADTVVIPNGFDPDEMPAHSPDWGTPLRLVFLGRFSRSVSDPVPLFEALARARSEGSPAEGATLDVMGPEADWAQAAAEAAGVGDAVRFHGFKPYSEALDMVSRADVAVLLIADVPGSRAIYSGKLFDYLGIGIPVLMCGPADGVAAKLLDEADAGRTVPPGDVEAIAGAMEWAARDKQAGRRIASPLPEVVSRFDRSRQAETVAQLLARIVERTRA